MIIIIDKDFMKKMILFLMSLAITACTASAPPAVSEPADKLAEVRARGTLVIATDADYMPQSRLIPGSSPASGTKCEPTQYTASQFEGFDVEVAREVAERLGVEPCFVTPAWSQLVAGNWGDHWDVHVGSVAITRERLEHLYFTQPYYATPIVILVHRENQSYETPEDLSGKRIGVCTGCTFESYLKGTLEVPGEKVEFRIQNAQVISYENEDPAIKSLSLGDGVELDAVITILPKARASIAAGSPVKILEQPLLFAYASITLDRAGRREAGRLLAEINRILREMHQTGRLKELSLQAQRIDLTVEAASYDIASLNQLP